MNHTYDPASIADAGVNQMRFELGDIDVDAGKAVLSDEEIAAAIDKNAHWAVAREKLAEGVCRRLAYEVDISADGMKLELSQRAERWAKLLEAMRKGRRRQTPRASSAGKAQGCPEHGGYFHTGMLGNARGGGSDG